LGVTATGVDLQGRIVALAGGARVGYGSHLVGALSVNMPPKTLRTWRAAVATRQTWTAAISGTLTSA
jgi:hypothetical protein